MAKTTAFLAISVALLGTALWAAFPRTNSVNDFRDLGQPFFPEFTDPALCTSLELFELDPDTARAREFAVKQRDGRWIIPSHAGYPADAEHRLAQTAAQVIGLTKDTIRSTRTEDHAILGVLDPRDTKIANVDGVGQRITLRDSSDRVLADYILGKLNPNNSGQRYVRRPGQVRTYGVHVQVQPSTRFADWIEPNLLALKGSTIVEANFDNSKWDPDFGRLLSVPEIHASRDSDGAPWTMEGLSPDQEVDPSKMTAMVQTLTDLKIVGVRPKPKILVEALDSPGRKSIDLQARLSLSLHGFHVTPNSQLMPEEGTVRISCSDGILYSLKFGKVTFARGEALSAGAADAVAKGEGAPQSAEPKKTRTGDEGAIESRFLFVTAGFDSKRIPPPKISTALPAIGTLPKLVFSRSAAELRTASEREQAEVESWQRRVESGRARAEALSRRFSPWYFVVPGDDYRSILLDRRGLVHAKPTIRTPTPPNPLRGGGVRLPPGPRTIPLKPDH